MTVRSIGVLSWKRPDSYWDVVVSHLPIALVAGIALGLPYVTACDALPLRKCTFLMATGCPCPFCGLTRSFWAVAHGNWGVALQNAPLAFIVYGGAVLLFFWHTIALITGVKASSPLVRLLKSPTGFRAIIAVILLNWAYRLARYFA